MKKLEKNFTFIGAGIFTGGFINVFSKIFKIQYQKYLS